MTKRQWFLVAGTLVLAACSGPVGPCETNDVTGEASNCPGQVSEQAESTPTPSIDEPESNKP